VSTPTTTAREPGGDHDELAETLSSRTDRSVNPPAGGSTVVLGNLQVNFAIFQVRVAGRAVPTGKQEFELLREIVLRHDTIVSSAELSELLWGETGPKYSRRLITLVHRLRLKLGEMDPFRLTTVRGVGYGLVSSHWWETDTGTEDRVPDGLVMEPE
jgi:DNA-binding response OmpR family regulator